MKKLRYIILILILLLLATLCFFKCKEVKALESEFFDDSVIISSNSQNDIGVVFLVNMANNSYGGSSDLILIGGAGNGLVNLLNITNYNGANPNMLYICNYAGTILDSYQLNSRILQIQIVEDTNELYLIIYQLSFNFQRDQGITPVLDGVNRSMITRYNLGPSVKSLYDSPNGLLIDIGWHDYYGNVNWNPNFLLNYSYIDYSDTPQDINGWIDNQLLNYLTFNQLLESSYNYGVSDGYEDGYNVGIVEGEDVGYSIGYDEGYDDGYDSGYVYGYDNGFEVGDNVGYANGYEDGEAGNNAVHPLWAMIRDIAGGIGDILALQLGPGITIGTIIFVPLFFSALGLILWIWRRN